MSILETKRIWHGEYFPTLPVYNCFNLSLEEVTELINMGLRANNNEDTRKFSAVNRKLDRIDKIVGTEIEVCEFSLG